MVDIAEVLEKYLIIADIILFALRIGQASITMFSSEIVYVEGKFRGCIVHAAKKSYPISQSFAEFTEGLGDRFYNCHRNISVNTAFIDRIEGSSAVLTDGRKLKSIS